jgi:hypothetical protein
MFRFFFSLAALGMVFSGCRAPAPAPYPTWSVAAANPSPDPTFDLYVQAAKEAETKGAKYLGRVYFYPDQRKAAAEMVAEPFRKVIQASGRSGKFPFRPHPPFTLRENQRGWGLLGRVFAWKIADSCEAGDYGNAIQLACAGSRFGFDLTGGGAMDAALGLSIADEVRRAIAPWIKSMTPAQQMALAAGMTAALPRLAPASQIIENEKQNMLRGVQAVQDAYQKQDLETLQKELGPTVKEAVEYLQNLRKEGDPARVAYFNGFAAEAETLTTYQKQMAGLPALDRRSRPEPTLAEERPWRRFARHFFETQPLILKSYDATVARTRILIVSARILAERKSGFPRDLSRQPKELATDPYTGQRFLYHHDAAQFSLYSVGPNLKDDGGESDATFSSPDLVLEAR